MIVPCRLCKGEMKYPYRVCKYCGWEPDGRFLEKANAFARKFEVEHGIVPKKTVRNAKGSGPRLVKPPPGIDTDRKKQTFNSEIIECPKCGKEITIVSPTRPIKISCKNCASMLKIIE